MLDKSKSKVIFVKHTYQIVWTYHKHPATVQIDSSRSIFTFRLFYTNLLFTFYYEKNRTQSLRIFLDTSMINTK